MSELFLLNIALINERRGKNYPGQFMNQKIIRNYAQTEKLWL